MKDLPIDPPIYTPPAELWYLRHQHISGGPNDSTRTMMAMWLMLHDRMQCGLPTAKRTFSTTEHEMFKTLEKKFGKNLMDAWDSACLHIDRDEAPAIAFTRLLSSKGLCHE